MNTGEPNHNSTWRRRYNFSRTHPFCSDPTTLQSSAINHCITSPSVQHFGSTFNPLNVPPHVNCTIKSSSEGESSLLESSRIFFST